MAKTNTQAKAKQSEFEEFMTVHEVASNLRVDDTTVRRWVKTGALKAITLPHRGSRNSYRIPKSSYDALFNDHGTTKAS